MQAKNHSQKHLDSQCLKLPILNRAAVELGENRSRWLYKNSFGSIEVAERTLDFNCGIRVHSSGAQEGLSRRTGETIPQEKRLTFLKVKPLLLNSGGPIRCVQRIPWHVQEQLFSSILVP